MFIGFFRGLFKLLLEFVILVVRGFYDLSTLTLSLFLRTNSTGLLGPDWGDGTAKLAPNFF